LDARAAERRKTAAILANKRTPLAVIEAAEHANGIARDALEGARKAYPPPALDCQEGCAWCCYQQVGTSAPEVIRIVTYLRQTLSPVELTALKERVAHVHAQKQGLSRAQRRESKLPCPLLVDQRCTAYPVRPLTCWGCNSADVRACEMSVKQPGRGAARPDYVPQRRLAAFVLDGLRAGLVEAGLKGDLLELVAALHVALQKPAAAELWLAGKPVFASANMD
jgi:hypothetical protein